MLSKIISGYQTGADIAAIDAAMYGNWLSLRRVGVEGADD